MATVKISKILKSWRQNLIIRNFFIQGVGQFGARLFFFLFFLYTARKIGPEQFGIFSLVLGLGYLIFSFMDFGLDTLVVKWVARNGRECFKSLCQFRILTTICGSFVFLGTSFFFKGPVLYNFILMGIGFFLFSFLNLFFSYWRGIEDMKWEAGFLLGQRCLLLILSILFYSVWPSALSASTSFVLSTFVIFLIILPIFKKILGNQLFKFNFNQFPDIFKEAWPLAIVGLLWAVYYRTDTVMLAYFQSMEDVGEYNGAFKFIEGIMLLMRVIMMVTFPKLVRLSSGDIVMFKVYFTKLLSLTLIVGLSAVITMYLISDVLFRSVLGPEYVNSIPIFKILLVSAFFMYVQTLLTHTLVAIDNHRMYMYVSMFCAGLNIVLNFIFIPRYGTIGAAWATAFTAFFVSLLCIPTVFRFCKVSVGK